MATYVNDLRLKEIATGDEAGTWGTSTNTNLELIAEAFSFGTEAITTNADTHTTTIADGSTDPGRSLFLKYTGTLDSACTITIGPNTVSKLWFIENATSGSQNIIIKQGSGATVTIPNGQTKAIYSDGAGSGGAMIDALQDLSIPDLFIDDDLTIGDDLVFSSDSAVITFGADGDTTLTHTDGSGLTLNSTNKIMFNDASQFIQGSSATVLALGATDEIDLTATAIDVNGTMAVSGELTGSTASFSSSSDSDVQLTLTNTGASSSHAPTLDMHRNSASPADDDQLGRIRFRGENDASENITYASITVLAADVTDATEDGTFRITTKQNGADKQRVSITSAETVFNEQSADIDFRVESDSKTHMLFVDAGNNHVNIGTSTDRGGLLNIETADNNSQLVLVSSDADASTGPRLDFLRDSASPADNDIVSQVRFRGKNDADEELSYAGIKVIALDVTDGTEDSELQISTIVAGASSNLLIMNSTEIVFNEGSKNTDFRVESNGNTHGLFVDAGNDRVGILNSSPATALDVTGVITTDGMTTSADINLGDDVSIRFGDVTNGDLVIKHDGTDSKIADRGTGDLIIQGSTNIKLQNFGGTKDYFTGSNNGASTIFHDGSAKLATTSTGIDVTGVITTDGMTTSADVNFADDVKAVFGDGSDLLIFHDGSDSHIRDQGTGNLIIRGNNLSLQSFGAASYLEAAVSGAVELYHNGNKKLETPSSGIGVTGDITTTTAGSDNINIGEAAGDAITSGGTSNIAIGKNANGSVTTGDSNIAIGVGALKTEDTGVRSIAIGTQALANQDRDGFNYNIAIGYETANDVTSGIKNIMVGGFAGDAITTGQENVAIGHVSLSTEVAGNYSVAVGQGTLQNQTNATSTNVYNVAVGYDAGNDITSGTLNTIVGGLAGDALTSGNSNTALGYVALSADTLGDRAVAIGHGALQNQNFTTTTDNYNVAVGYNAGNDITTGVVNTIVGGLAGDALTDADHNVAVGYLALTSDTKGSRSTALGRSALTTQNFTTATDVYNVAVGYDAGGDITVATQNTLVGGLSGASITEGDANVAVGYGALNSDTLGTRTVAIGYLALQNQNFTTATNANNIAIGWETGRNVTNGQNNVLIGAQAGHDIVGGDNNVAVGTLALDAETEGQNSTAIGRGALGAQNFTTATNTNNVAVGYNAGVSVTTGKDNTLIGGLAADVMTTGDGNTFVGKASAGAGDVTGNNNSALGIASGQQLTSGSNNLLLGHDAGISGSPGGQIDTESNTIVLGDEIISSFNCQVALTVASDERDKTDFVDLDLGLEFVKALEPVTYYWDRRSSYGDKEAEDYDLTAQTPDGTHKEDWMDVGFKAQSVQALEEAAGYSVGDKSNLTVSLSSDGNQYGLKYEKFVPILVKAIQEQDAIIASLTARIAALES